jgi:uncharacterized protein YndB with AHSA1/START domain
MDISVSIVIARPVEAVFEFVSNYERDPQWRTGVIEMMQMPPGRSQVGTKTREVGRFFGRKMITPGEVTKCEPNREVAFAGLMADEIRVSGRRTVEPVGEQTRFTYQATVELRGFYRLLEPLMAASLRKRFAGDLRRLKERLEASVGEPSGRVRM